MGSVNQAYAQIPDDLGWYAVPSSSWRSLCPANSSLHGTQDCSAVVDQWSGGIFDSARNRLCWWGGGHNSYYGNEIYCHDLDTNTTSRITDASTSPLPPSGTVLVMNDGNPSSRHTYNHLVYVPTIDRYYMFGGSTPILGSFGTDTWFFNPTNNTWAQQSVTGNVPGGFWGMNAVWNPNDSKIYLQSPSVLTSFDPSTLVYTNVKSDTEDCSHRVGTIDTKRNYYYDFYPTTNGAGGSNCGTFGGTVRRISLSGTISSNNWETVSTSGATSILTADWMGTIYDPATDRIVLWDTGSTVYTMDPATGVLSSHSLGGVTGPNKHSVRGTLSRWQLSLASGVFVVANDPDDNVYTFRIADFSVYDFYNRRTAPGVLYSNGFDSAAEFGSYQTSRPNTGPFCPGAAGSCSSIVRDPTLYTSCGDLTNCGAVKYIVAGPGENPSGSYEVYYGTDSDRETREGETVYIQWKKRQDSLANLGGSGWKTFTLYYNTDSCGTLELTETNSSYRNLPFLYSECGGRTLTWDYASGPNPVLNWSVAYPPGGVGGDDDFFCQYNSGNPAAYGPNKCPFYEVNSWRTYYCEVTIGTWGGANSTIKCGQYDDGDTDWRWYVNRTNYVLNKQPAATGFNVISFTNYMTDRGSDPDLANFWVDEVIISSQPIALPGQAAASEPPPPATGSELHGVGISGGSLQ